MPLDRLMVQGFRNLEPTDIVLHPRLNFVAGLNGAGKSSLLEAIHFLCVGRSFRTRRYSRLVNHGSTKFDLFGQFKGGSGAATKVGVSKGRAVNLLKVDGQNVTSAGKLAKLNPSQVINSQSFDLLEGGPKQRRQFVDWLVFHVKHSYGDLWGQANHCIKQRNALLRDDRVKRKDFEFWDRQLVELTLQINQARTEAIEPYLIEANALLSQCSFVKTPTLEKNRLGISFIPGWPEEKAYNDALAEAFEKDRTLGYTTVGFHKADLKFRVDRHPLVEIYSRGQQKVIISGLYLAQFRAMKQLAGKAGVLLVDDLPAEMDDNNIALFASWVDQLDDVQTIVTGIDLGKALRQWPGLGGDQSSHKMFHVKHGHINEEPCNWSYS